MVLPDVEEELRKGAFYIRGSDRLGNPILVCRVALFLPEAKKALVYQKTLVYVLDGAIRNMVNPLGQFVLIMDFTGSGYSNFDYYTIKLLVETLLNHYPERLADCFLCHVTWTATVFWKAIQTLMDEKVREKIHLLSFKTMGEYRDYFRKHAVESHLPTFCGGEDAYELDPEDIK